MDMQDGVAIVTGSSSGVGSACARQLAERGCHVVINYAHNADGAEQTREACAAFGVETVVVQADVADDAQCRALAQAALDKWGRIDALVNNAGITKFNAHENLEGLSRQDFLDWAQPDHFRRAHAQSGPPEGVVEGHPHAKFYEAVIVEQGASAPVS